MQPFVIHHALFLVPDPGRSILSSVSGANVHTLEHRPFFAFPTHRDGLNIVLIGAGGEERCCGACQLLPSAVYGPWLLMPVVFLSGLVDLPGLFEGCRSKGAQARCGTWPLAALGIIRQEIDRGIDRSTNVLISVVSEG